MSSDGQEKRDRLKEEYKEHYRKIKEAKERFARSQRSKKITDALNDMDASQLTDTFDEFLYKVKSKIANVEARLDIAMDSLAFSDGDALQEQEHDEELKRAKAKETLRQAKIEMGLLYSEIEQQADSLEVNKTIGKKPGLDQEESVDGKESEKNKPE
ncbi:MAG: hypothetical protein U5J95_06750 [Balneolaceae bacterium]|nr:hypothetical protein [Balneolaceae bacterium]